MNLKQLELQRLYENPYYDKPYVSKIGFTTENLARKQLDQLEEQYKQNQIKNSSARINEQSDQDFKNKVKKITNSLSKDFKMKQLKKLEKIITDTDKIMQKEKILKDPYSQSKSVLKPFELSPQELRILRSKFDQPIYEHGIYDKGIMDFFRKIIEFSTGLPIEIPGIEQIKKRLDKYENIDLEMLNTKFKPSSGGDMDTLVDADRSIYPENDQEPSILRRLFNTVKSWGPVAGAIGIGSGLLYKNWDTIKSGIQNVFGDQQDNYVIGQDENLIGQYENLIGQDENIIPENTERSIYGGYPKSKYTERYIYDIAQEPIQKELYSGYVSGYDFNQKKLPSIESDLTYIDLESMFQKAMLKDDKDEILQASENLTQFLENQGIPQNQINSILSDIAINASKSNEVYNKMIEEEKKDVDKRKKEKEEQNLEEIYEEEEFKKDIIQIDARLNELNQLYIMALRKNLPRDQSLIRELIIENLTEKKYSLVDISNYIKDLQKYAGEIKYEDDSTTQYGEEDDEQPFLEEKIYEEKKEEEKKEEEKKQEKKQIKYNYTTTMAPKNEDDGYKKARLQGNLRYKLTKKNTPSSQGIEYKNTKGNWVEWDYLTLKEKQTLYPNIYKGIKKSH